MRNGVDLATDDQATAAIKAGYPTTGVRIQIANAAGLQFGILLKNSNLGGSRPFSYYGD